MPDTSQLETFAAGMDTAVDVAGIERQLNELWQVAAESGKDPGSRAVTRASLFNLVVYCETDAARDHATATISELTSRNPCRAIVLSAKPDAPQPELSASITAHCHLAGGGRKQVCCEQISINAAGRSVTDLPGAVLPLLESDLPTVLWWQGNFLERTELFSRLSSVADRIFFDTSMWPVGARGRAPLRELFNVIAANARCNFADLSWTRLAPWRALTAEVFDEPRCRAELHKINQIAIAHGCGPGAGLRALLYASWLATQLHWSPRDAVVRIQLSARDDPDATDVGIISVGLKSDSATVSIHKNHGERAASATVEMPDVCGLPRKRAFWPTDDASLISQELDHSARHTVYERALAMAADVSEAEKGKRFV